MTATLAPLATAPRRAASRRPARLLTVAAAGYSVAWLAGLATPAPMIELDAAPSAVLAAVAGEEAAMALRSVLVHGVAGVLLAVVATAVSRVGARSGARRAARVLRAAGLVAAALSLTQMALELTIAGPVAAGGDAAAVDTLLDTVNRVDGVKMVALAVMVAAGAATAVHGRRLRAVALVGVPALIASAAGYGLLMPALAPAAYVSLPLLLVWVTGAGVAAARASRR